jgi:hypothetical protein
VAPVFALSPAASAGEISAAANILAALDVGVQWLEGAICGIGGGIAMPTKLGSLFPTRIW